MSRFSVVHKITSLIVMGAIAFISVVRAYPVYASPCSRFRHETPSHLHTRILAGPMILKMLRKNLHKNSKLDLSEQQQRQIEEEVQKFREMADDIRQEFQIGERFVRTQKSLHGKRPVDTNLDTRHYMARLRFRNLFTQHLTAIFNILTPEQQAKLRTRGMTVLVLYILSAEFQKLVPAPRIEKLTTMPPVQVERTAEHLLLPEEILSPLVVQEHFTLSLTAFLHQQDILRI